MEGDGSVAVSCSIVEELGDGNGCGFSAFGLGRGERSESDEHGAVNGTGVVEEDTNDFLKTSEALGVERFGCVGWWSQLGVSAIYGSVPGVW